MYEQMVVVRPLGNGSMAFEATVGDDRCPIQTFRDDLCLIEGLVPLTLRHNRRLLIIRLWPVRDFGMYGCRADSADHFICGTVFLEPVQSVLIRFRSDAVLLDLLHHLSCWNLVVEHVIDIVHAKRTLLFGSAFRRLRVAN